MTLDDVAYFEGRGNKMTQFLNVLIKRGLTDLKYRELTRNGKFYNIEHRNANPVEDYGMNVWRGFFTSVQIWNGVPFLQINPCSKVERTESALQFINQFRSRDEVIQNIVETSVISNYG